MMAGYYGGRRNGLKFRLKRIDLLNAWHLRASLRLWMRPGTNMLKSLTRHYFAIGAWRRCGLRKIKSFSPGEDVLLMSDVLGMPLPTRRKSEPCCPASD